LFDVIDTWHALKIMFRLLACLLISGSEQVHYNLPGQFWQVSQLQDWTAPLCSSRRADRKTYMVRSVWCLVKLIIIFERFSTLGMQQNQPGRFACMCGCPAPVKTAMLYSGPN